MSDTAWRREGNHRRPGVCFALVTALAMGLSGGAAPAQSPVAGLQLPPTFDIDLSQWEMGFSAAQGYARPTERRPEKYLLHFQGSSFSGDWEVAQYPINGGFGYSADTWHYTTKGQWDADGKVSGYSVLRLEQVAHHKGQQPYQIHTREEHFALTGSVDAGGKLTLTFVRTRSKWTFKGRETKVPNQDNWTWTFDLPVTSGPPDGTPPPSPTPRSVYVPRIKLDKDTYMVGERVILTLEIEEWVEETLPGGSKRSVLQRSLERGAVNLTFHFPGDLKLTGLEAQLSSSRRVAALAPIAYGDYTISARAVLGPEYLSRNPEVQGPLSEAEASATFRCVAPSAELEASTEARMERLVAMFKQAIPSHRLEVEMEFHRRNPLRWAPTPTGGEVTHQPTIGDMQYGSYNNAYFRRTNAQGEEEGNDWVCGSCQGKSLEFCNNARFLNPDATLMIGIHHGPIVRGFPSLGKKFSLGEHHGVVVYKYTDAYSLPDNRVFDPWPRQTPDVFPFWRFERCYFDWDAYSPHTLAGAAPDYTVHKPGVLSGFPTHGGPCYWNTRWPIHPAQGADPQIEKVSIRTPVIHRRVFCNCPVVLDVSDEQGRHTGLSGGKLVYDIPGSDFSVLEKSQGDLSWAIALPQGEYTVRLTGTGRGVFQVETTDAGGASCIYAAAIDKDQTAEVRLSDAQPEPPLVRGDGTQIPPRRVSPLPDDRSTGASPEAAPPSAADASAIFTAKDVRQWREKLVARSALPDEHPDGWSKSPVDPAGLLSVFPRLRLRRGYALRAYVFKEDGNASGFVWALPAEAAFPAPDECPRVESHFLAPPKPFDALDDVMEVIEGDDSLESYLQASILRRELKEFAGGWHGIKWGMNTVLDESPWKARREPSETPVYELPESKPEEWTWLAAQPTDWAPEVRRQQDRVVVTFYSYTALSAELADGQMEKERIIQHTDTYRRGNYRPLVVEKKLAEGPNALAR